MANNSIVKRSISIAARKTSVSLEGPYWESLKEISMGRGETISQIVGGIDGQRGQNNLSSAIRLFVLDYYRQGYGKQALAGIDPGKWASDQKPTNVADPAHA